MWSMKWQMRWRNKSAATINTTLQLLDIYRLLNWSLPNIFTTISPSLSSHVRVPWSMDLSHFFRTIYTFYLCSSVMVALIFFFSNDSSVFYLNKVWEHLQSYNNIANHYILYALICKGSTNNSPSKEGSIRRYWK